MSSQTIPDDEELAIQVFVERFEKSDDLLLLDAARMEPEHALSVAESGDDRHVVPVEVKLDDGCLPLRRPSAHSRGAFADPGLVDKDDQAFFALGFFLRAGQVLRFQRCTAFSSRSRARFSGF